MNKEEINKRFMRLLNERTILSSLEEDEQDDNNQNGGAPMGGQDPMGGAPQGDIGGQDPMGGGAPQGDPMGGAPQGDMGGQDPMGGAPQGDIGGQDQMGGAPQGDMGGDPMGGEDPMGGDQMMGGEDPMGGAPMGEDPMGSEDPMGGEEDEVIDVEDITSAQEKMNTKVNHVGRNLGKVDDKLVSLYHTINKLESMIDDNNSQIMALKQEFEKRNPTPTEKLNLRSLDSYPFNVNPVDYWKEKSTTSNYKPYSDNDESPTEEYEITNNDVDDFSEREMADSFFIPDEWQQDLKKIFNN
jgi:hypothetical protein